MVVSPSTRRSIIVRFGRAPPGAITDQQLMFNQERLSRDASRTTRAEQFHQGDEQMDRQDERIAHD